MPPQPLKRDSFIDMEGMQGTASCYSNGVSLENDNHQIKNSNLQNHQQYQSHVQGNNDSEGDDKIKPLPFGATGVEYEDSRANRVSIDNSTSTFHTFMPPQPLKRDSFINMEGMQGTASCYSNGVSLENDNHQINNSNLQNHQQYQRHVQGNDDSEGDDKIKPLPVEEMSAIWRSGEININRTSSKRLSKAKGSWRSGDIDSLMCRSIATMSLDGNSSCFMGESTQSIHPPIGLRIESALQQPQPMSCQTLDTFESRRSIMTKQSQESKIDMSLLSLNTFDSLDETL